MQAKAERLSESHAALDAGGIALDARLRARRARRARREWLAEWEALLEGLWPSACAVCGAWASDHAACARHPLALEEASARCGLCSRALPTGVVVQRADPQPPWRSSGVRARRATWRRCRECRVQAPGYGRLLCLGDYGAALRPWVLALKHGRRTVALPLARLLAERLRAAGWLASRADGVRVVLVPVPSHRWRRFERGADGPRALARALGREMGWPVLDLLERVRFTTPQGDPGSVSRAENVNGALRVAWAGLGRSLGVSDSVNGRATLGDSRFALWTYRTLQRRRAHRRWLNAGSCCWWTMSSLQARPWPRPRALCARASTPSAWRQVSGCAGCCRAAHHSSVRSASLGHSGGAPNERRQDSRFRTRQPCLGSP